MGDRMSVHRVSDPGVKAVLASYPQEMRWALEDLRTTILDVADAIPAVGRVEENLKWGQPAYRPVGSRVGTTVRIGPLTRSEDVERLRGQLKANGLNPTPVKAD